MVEKANTAMFSVMPQSSHHLNHLLGTSGSACHETDHCRWVAGISTFLNPHSLSIGAALQLGWEPSEVTLILPGQDDAV